MNKIYDHNLSKWNEKLTILHGDNLVNYDIQVGGYVDLCKPKSKIESVDYSDKNIKSALRRYTMDEDHTEFDQGGNKIKEGLGNHVSYCSLMIKTSENRFKGSQKVINPMYSKNNSYEIHSKLLAINMYLFIQGICLKENEYVPESPTPQLPLRPVEDIVYRIVDNDWNKILRLVDNSEIMFPSLTSTSKDIVVTENFFIEHLKKNLKKEYKPILFEINISSIKHFCVDIENMLISHYQKEKEVLLPGGVYFKIESKEEIVIDGIDVTKVSLLSLERQPMLDNWKGKTQNFTRIPTHEELEELLPKIGKLDDIYNLCQGLLSTGSTMEGGNKKKQKTKKNMKVIIKKSTNPKKKYMAIFYENKKKVKTTHFGAAGMSDYTKHKDKSRKRRYLTRHRNKEKWNDYMSAGSLSRYILWGEPTFRASVQKYKKKFNLE
jgi:hypothetical protein